MKRLIIISLFVCGACFGQNVVTNGVSILKSGTNIARVTKCSLAALTPPDLTFVTNLTLTLTTIDGSSCYYTTDGSTPNMSKTLYVAPFVISATTTVKWINMKGGYANSSVGSRTITKVP